MYYFRIGLIGVALYLGTLAFCKALAAGTEINNPNRAAADIVPLVRHYEKKASSCAFFSSIAIVTGLDAWSFAKWYVLPLAFVIMRAVVALSVKGKQMLSNKTESGGIT